MTCIDSFNLSEEGGNIMPIAVEVAKVSGALRCGIERDCLREVIPYPRPEVQSRSAAPEKTLWDFLDDTAAWAKASRKKILAELRKGRKKK